MINEIMQVSVLVIVVLCTAAIIFSIIINFAGAKTEKPKRERRSVVATGTMALFFMVFYLLIKLKIGTIEISNIYLRIPMIIIGLIIIIFGTYVNIQGRLSLGRNWANHIKIYEDHTLVNRGVYKIVRHPLYASLIWIFYAASIVYLNYLAFLANTLVFIPFMYYRAKQEEEMLMKQFKTYKEYIQNVGMFFPKIK